MNLTPETGRKQDLMSEDVQPVTTDPEVVEVETTDLVAEVEKWKALSRKNEERAKANAEAAEKLAEIEAANLSEIEKAQARAEALEKELQESKYTALKSGIANEFQISVEDSNLFLTASDEEGLRKQAEALKARTATSTPPVGNVVPGLGDRTLHTPKSSDDIAKSFFGI